MRIVINECVGETRAAVYESKKCVELHLSRESERGRAFPGEVFSGRIRSVDSSLSAAFVDIGAPPHAFLNFALAQGAPKFREGQMVRVKVTREAEQAKGPIVSFIELSDAPEPVCEIGGDILSRLKHRFPEAEIEKGETPDFDAATERDISLKGGGSISIEPTKAVCAIDVDTGRGLNKKSVSVAAAKESVRQIRLRGIGGLILIDFPNFRQKKDRDDVWQCLVDNFEYDPLAVKIAPMSRFGTVEISRAKPARSLMEMRLDRYGQSTAETIALSALERLVREGAHAGGAQLTAHLPKPAHDWLMAEKIEWKDALINRIGARFSFNISDRLDIVSDRPA